MEKNEVSPFKSKYVRLVKDNGEIINGTIVDILEDSVIFQTELSRKALSIKSITGITEHAELQKSKKFSNDFKL